MLSCDLQHLFVFSDWVQLMYSYSQRYKGPIVYKSAFELTHVDQPTRRHADRNCTTSQYSETWITQTAGDHQKSLSYEKFDLWVMLSLCFSHVATVVSPFCSIVFHFPAKLSKIWEIFFSVWKENNEINLVSKNVNTSSHRKGNLMALTAVCRVMTKGSRYTQQIIITQAGTTIFVLS